MACSLELVFGDSSRLSQVTLLRAQFGIPVPVRCNWFCAGFPVMTRPLKYALY